ncbi:hypothetical protein AKJ16_DCAP23940 [Drosera capensis]
MKTNNLGSKAPFKIHPFSPFYLDHDLGYSPNTTPTRPSKKPIVIKRTQNLREAHRIQERESEELDEDEIVISVLVDPSSGYCAALVGRCDPFPAKLRFTRHRRLSSSIPVTDTLNHIFACIENNLPAN